MKSNRDPLWTRFAFRSRRTTLCVCHNFHLLAKGQCPAFGLMPDLAGVEEGPSNFIFKMYHYRKNRPQGGFDALHQPLASSGGMMRAVKPVRYSL
jgi:hypothetical protein